MECIENVTVPWDLVRGEMNDAIDGASIPKRFRESDIRLDERELRVMQIRLNVSQEPVREVIDPNHVVSAFNQEAQEIRPNESGNPGDQNSFGR